MIKSHVMLNHVMVEDEQSKEPLTKNGLASLQTELAISIPWDVLFGAVDMLDLFLESSDKSNNDITQTWSLFSWYPRQFVFDNIIFFQVSPRNIVTCFSLQMI